MAIVGRARQAHPQTSVAPGLSAVPRMRLTMAAARRVLDRVLCIGVREGLPVNAGKRVRLCNVIALGGSLIMGAWAVLEAIDGTRSSVGWELGFMAAFLAVLGMSAAGAHRLARLLLLATANVSVLAGAVLYPESSGGLLPFFAMAALPLLLFRSGEWLSATLGAALPALLLVACKTGLAGAFFSVHPRPAPLWYFGANAVTTFVLAFLVPFFFFRSNLKAEASLQRIGQEKLKRVIDAESHRRRARAALGAASRTPTGRSSACSATRGRTWRPVASISRMIAPPGSSEAELAQLRPQRRLRADLRPQGRNDRADVGGHRPPRRRGRRDDGRGRRGGGRGQRRGHRLRPRSRRRRSASRPSAPCWMTAGRRSACATSSTRSPRTSSRRRSPRCLLNLRLLRERVEREHAEDAPLRRQVTRCEICRRADGRAHPHAARRGADPPRQAHAQRSRHRGGRGGAGTWSAGSRMAARGARTASRSRPTDRSPLGSIRCGSIRSSPTSCRTRSSTAPASRSRCGSTTISPATSPTWRSSTAVPGSTPAWRRRSSSRSSARRRWSPSRASASASTWSR